MSRLSILKNKGGMSTKTQFRLPGKLYPSNIKQHTVCFSGGKIMGGNRRGLTLFDETTMKEIRRYDDLKVESAIGVRDGYFFYDLEACVFKVDITTGKSTEYPGGKVDEEMWPIVELSDGKWVMFSENEEEERENICLVTDLETARVEWDYPGENLSLFGVVFSSNLLITDDEKIMSLDLQDGTVNWTKNVDDFVVVENLDTSSFESEVYCYDGIAVTMAQANKGTYYIVGLDACTGERLWCNETRRGSKGLLSPNGLYINMNTTIIEYYDIKTGEILKSFPLSMGEYFPRNGSEPGGIHDIEVTDTHLWSGWTGMGGGSGLLAAHDIETGELAYTHQFDCEITGVFIRNNRIFLDTLNPGTLDTGPMATSTFYLEGAGGYIPDE